MNERVSSEDRSADGPRDGIALCLSGGGYRAMVFHLGALIRLDEAGALGKLSRVSSVSGGSVTAGALGLLWRDLGFGPDGRARRLDLLVDRVLEMASTGIDVGAVAGGILMPGTAGNRVAAAYDRVLFKGGALADLPDDERNEGPRFVLNAANLQSGALWRFSRPYMGDYRIGLVRNPDVPLATAVAASSAFPPMLSPLVLRVQQPYAPDIASELHDSAFRERVVLSDGGVYDNLGLETAFKRCRTLLVSDGGRKVVAKADPPLDWPRQTLRVLDVVDNQVRSLRKRQLIEAFKAARLDPPAPPHARTGTYWGIATPFGRYGDADDPLGCGGRDATDLAELPTRLSAITRAQRERVVNWGYAICDVALRTHVRGDLAAELGLRIDKPAGFPFQRGY